MTRLILSTFHWIARKLGLLIVIIAILVIAAVLRSEWQAHREAQEALGTQATARIATFQRELDAIAIREDRDQLPRIDLVSRCGKGAVHREPRQAVRREVGIEEPARVDDAARRVDRRFLSPIPLARDALQLRSVRVDDEQVRNLKTPFLGHLRKARRSEDDAPVRKPARIEVIVVREFRNGSRSKRDEIDRSVGEVAPGSTGVIQRTDRERGPDRISRASLLTDLTVVMPLARR
jgi:hypothetical protein